MSLLRLDGFHCALLVAIVLLAVYVFGSFREGASSCDLKCPANHKCTFTRNSGAADERKTCCDTKTYTCCQPTTNKTGEVVCAPAPQF